MMESDEILFFDRAPRMLEVYAALSDLLKRRYPELQIRVGRTQISFSNRHIFAMVSLPIRRRRDWPEECLIVSFGLPCRIESLRIFQAVEPYPGRWTHHVPIERADEIDAELMDWIDTAYHFSMLK